MVKDHSDSERGKPLPPHGLLFTIKNKGSFICIIPYTYHGLCYTSRGALAGTLQFRKPLAVKTAVSLVKLFSLNYFLQFNIVNVFI